MRSRTPQIIAFLVVGCVSAGASNGATLGTDLVVSGLTRPLFVTAPPGDHTRLFILEQYVGGLGQIRIFDRVTNTLLATPFFSIPVSQSGEQGLLGLAFHPDYANNGRFFVNYTAPDTYVAEYRVSSNPNVADPNSRVLLLAIDQPFSNHNGGWIGFGPDGYLHIATGDGGASNDPDNHAQNPNDLLGKILRLDVDRDDFPADPDRNYGIPADNPFVGIDGADEVWMLGLRNPWRWARPPRIPCC
ncbi:MAG: PQQ-dependent sugar dehydrogenase [Phycisphaerales bacterium]|nr:PQQ-dependent sugar dehydrogenase [Phycisphaerales bacterium]